MKLFKFNYKGQSLFEVVVALAISALIITAIVSLVTNSIRNSTYSKNESQASRYAQELVEWLRGQRNDNTQAVLNYVGPEYNQGGSTTWCLPDLKWTSPSRPTYGSACDPGNDVINGTSFVRGAVFRIVHPVVSGRTLTVIEVDVTVTWTDSQGDHKVVNSTSLSDLRQR